MSGGKLAAVHAYALPEPVLSALMQAAEFAKDLPIAVCLVENVLADMLEQASAERPLDVGAVLAWYEQLQWLIRRVDADNDTLLDALRKAGLDR